MRIGWRMLIVELTLDQGDTSHFGDAHICLRHGFVFGMNGGCLMCWQRRSLTICPFLRVFSFWFRGNNRIQTRCRLRVPFPHSAEHYKKGIDFLLPLPQIEYYSNSFESFTWDQRFLHFSWQHSRRLFGRSLSAQFVILEWCWSSWQTTWRYCLQSSLHWNEISFV